MAPVGCVKPPYKNAIVAQQAVQPICNRQVVVRFRSVAPLPGLGGNVVFAFSHEGGSIPPPGNLLVKGLIDARPEDRIYRPGAAETV